MLRFKDDSVLLMGKFVSCFTWNWKVVENNYALIMWIISVSSRNRKIAKYYICTNIKAGACYLGVKNTEDRTA